MKQLILIISGVFIGFILCLLWLSKSAYETGQKMAMLKVTAALKEGLRERRTFGIRGLDGVEFRPMKTREALVVVGAGDQGIRMVEP